MRDRVVFIAGANGGLASDITRRARSTRDFSDQPGHELD